MSHTYFFSCVRETLPPEAITVRSNCFLERKRVWKLLWGNCWGHRKIIWESLRTASSSTIKNRRSTISRTCWTNGFGMRRRWRAASERDARTSTSFAVWCMPPLRGLSHKSSWKSHPPLTVRVIFSYPRTKLRHSAPNRTQLRELNATFVLRER